jgi:eukaryotic-like serine/threonine-protein kinase
VRPGCNLGREPESSREPPWHNRCDEGIMRLAPELRIRRNLALVRPLGEGGMATVWVADDLSNRRRVAVKILRQDFTSNPEAVHRFTLEAKVIARIRSPHVPKVFGQGTLPDGTPFMTMELMEGDDLDVYLRAHGPLSLRATATLVSQIAAALEAAHRLGVVHRDVKAENVFIQGKEEHLEAKLFDFGIARVPSEARHTQLGIVMGTPGYMSPEQLRSAKDADARADLWALGVVAYVALSCRLPFAGETYAETCIAVHHGVYDPPSQLRPGLPRELDAWFAKAFHRDAGARFQTANELSATLLAIVRGDRRAAGPERDELVDASDPNERHSVAGVTHTGPVHEPRRGIHLPLIAVAAATIIYSMTAAGAWSWLPSSAAAVAPPMAAPAPSPPPAPPPRLVTASPPEPLPSTSPPAMVATPRRHDTPRARTRSAPAMSEAEAQAALAKVFAAVKVAPETAAFEDDSDASAPTSVSPNLPIGFGDSRD